MHGSVWKNEKFTLTEKIFRQINYLVISLVKNDAFTEFLPKKCENTWKWLKFPQCVTSGYEF